MNSGAFKTILSLNITNEWKTKPLEKKLVVSPREITPAKRQFDVKIQVENMHVHHTLLVADIVNWSRPLGD